MYSHGLTRSLGESALCRFQRGVNDERDPYSNRKENQSAIEVVSLSEDRVEPVLTPKSPDGINQKVDRDWGRCNGDCDCRVESRDVRLEDGYGTRNEEGIDGGDLVVERVFYTFRGVEYEDSWGCWSILTEQDSRLSIQGDSLKQNAVM